MSARSTERPFRPADGSTRGHDDRFTDVMLMTNATKGSTTFHTVQIQRRPDGNGLFASLAYSTGSTQDLNSGTGTMPMISGATTLQFCRTSQC